MKTLKQKTLALSFVLALCAAVLVPFLAVTPHDVLAQSAQNSLVQTTLSVAQTAGSNTLTVASTTGITVTNNTTSTLVYVDRELETVIAISGKQLTVARGASGTRAAPHASGTMALSGNPTYFFQSDPSGSCGPAGTQLATPYVNVISGEQWLCSTITLTWVPGWNNPNTKLVTTAVASAAGTITPSGPLFHITGTNSITGFVTPLGCNATAVGGCQFLAICDAVCVWTAAGNISAASGTVVAKTGILFTWDATTSKWIPTPVV